MLLVLLVTLSLEYSTSTLFTVAKLSRAAFNSQSSKSQLSASVVSCLNWSAKVPDVAWHLNNWTSLFSPYVPGLSPFGQLRKLQS